MLISILGFGLWLAVLITFLIILPTWLAHSIHSQAVKKVANPTHTNSRPPKYTFGTLLSGVCGLLQLFAFSQPFGRFGGTENYANDLMSGYFLFGMVIYFVSFYALLFIPISTTIAITRLYFNYKQPIQVIYHSTLRFIFFSLAGFSALLWFAWLVLPSLNEPISNFSGLWLSLFLSIGIILGNILDILQGKLQIHNMLQSFFGPNKN